MEVATLSNGRPPSAGKGSKRAQLALLLGDRKRLVAALSVCSIISGFTEAALLTVIAQVAQALVKNSKYLHAYIGHIAIDARVGTMIEIAFALSIVRLAVQVPLSTLPSRIAAAVQLRLRTQLFDAFSDASWAVQAQDREGQLQETMTNQISQATAGALQTTTLINASFTFLVLMGTALAINPLAAVLVGTLSVGMFALLRPLRGRGVGNARALSRSQVQYAGAIAESIRVAQETHVFGVNDVQRERIGGFVATSNVLFYRTQVLARLVGNLYQSLIYILLVCGIAGLYWFGGGRAGSLAAVILLLLRGGTAGMGIQTAYQGLAQSLPFVDRTQEAMERYENSRPPDGGKTLARVDTVVFDDVSFAYTPERTVLSGLSFEVKAGEVIGIIGPSGAGKSTLVQLLLRLRLPAVGHYLINGVPVEEFSRHDWHTQVSFVPQEPRLLHASVADNIRFFREIPDEDVERAARLARIDEDITGWPDGYETIVGPRADAVSGGQQQRICLARALAARPEVLILDEPTSALDPHSETLITESLQALKSDLTLFIIAHRMSTLDICDRVMVIVDGRLMAFDTKALLQRNNTYYRHASQLAAGSSDEDGRKVEVEAGASRGGLAWARRRLSG